MSDLGLDVSPLTSPSWQKEVADSEWQQLKNITLYGADARGGQYAGQKEFNNIQATALENLARQGAPTLGTTARPPGGGMDSAWQNRIAQTYLEGTNPVVSSFDAMRKSDLGFQRSLNNDAQKFNTALSREGQIMADYLEKQAGLIRGGSGGGGGRGGGGRGGGGAGGPGEDLPPANASESYLVAMQRDEQRRVGVDSVREKFFNDRLAEVDPLAPLSGSVQDTDEGNDPRFDQIAPVLDDFSSTVTNGLTGATLEDDLVSLVEVAMQIEGKDYDAAFADVYNELKKLNPFGETEGMELAEKKDLTEALASYVMGMAGVQDPNFAGNNVIDRRQTIRDARADEFGAGWMTYDPGAVSEETKISKWLLGEAPDLTQNSEFDSFYERAIAAQADGKLTAQEAAVNVASLLQQWGGDEEALEALLNRREGNLYQNITNDAGWNRIEKQLDTLRSSLVAETARNDGSQQAEASRFDAVRTKAEPEREQTTGTADALERLAIKQRKQDETQAYLRSRAEAAAVRTPVDDSSQRAEASRFNFLRR